MNLTPNECRSIVARLWAAGVLLIAACAGRAEDLTQVGGDSESHFLAFCEPGDCAEGLVCWYGVCTDVCATDADCSSRAEGAACRTLQEAASPAPAVCDVTCTESSDCSQLGASFRCAAGLCRAPGAKSGMYRACSPARPCTDGSTCIDNTCSVDCDSDADCENGARCVPTMDVGQSYCAFACTDELQDMAAAQCSFMGAGGRCSSGVCRETLTSECALASSDGSEWSCYENIAAEAFRLRHEALLSVELCLPATESHVFDYDYRACGEATCANGEPGCPVHGLVLETEPLRMESPFLDLPQTVMSAQGDIRVREPIQVVYELLDPPERCEYSIEARFWNLAFIDGYTYLSPYLATQYIDSAGVSTSTAAIEGGYWQVVRYPFLGHAGGSSSAAIIEDSSSEIELLAGGERCRAIQLLVGAAVRDSLVNSINGVLEAWLLDIDDTLECSLCGQPGCELACRFR